MDPFISPILQILFDKIVTKAENAVKSYQQKKKNIKELPETFRWLKEKLKDVEALLSKAEVENNEVLEKWHHDLQDLAYDLEDILDAYATNLRLKELDSQSKEQEDVDVESTLSCSGLRFPSLKVPCFLTGNSETSDVNNKAFLTKINDIRNRLREILTGVETLNLKSQTSHRDEPQTSRQAEETSLPPEIVFGRVKENRTVIHQLLNGETTNNKKNYIVIPIVGPGGIGKTTFAQSVYNNDEINRDHFDIKVWVSVSDVFDVHQITTAIISAASDRRPSEFSNLNEAQVKLQNILSGKKFLIVLDDVWNNKYHLWEQLQTPFLGGLKGSRVIVTTRMEEVARIMVTKSETQSHGVTLEGLSDNECWKICKHHASINDDSSIDEIQNRVIELSKGLPLAAKALGGLLKKVVRCNWSTILKRRDWREDTGVLPALRLSYNHLPHYLKRVFSYCSVFPKDHEMDEEAVVLMWMAEGFVADTDTESMESMGHRYFADLVSRSLFEPRSRRGERYFVMHNLIHDLAQWAAGDVCSVIQTDQDHVKDRTRFMSVTNRDFLSNNVGDVGENLRTFARWGYVNNLKRDDATFQRFQCLRVLCIPSKGGSVELPSYIGNLKHLRLLDLSMNDLKELPISMSKLCNIQSLVLKCCRNLSKVFINLESFVELRHLDIEGSDLQEMPKGFGKLTNLRTSRQFIIGANSGSRICELEKLKQLNGSLDIIGLENVMSSEDAQTAMMHEKPHLEILRMFWGALPSVREYDTSTKLVDLVQRSIPNQPSIEKEVLNKLVPPESIKELRLDGYTGISLPDWLGSTFLWNMVVLKLNLCSECESLPQLGQLSALEELVVKNMNGIKRIGLEFYGDGCSKPFPKLKKFKIKSMNQLKEWLQPAPDVSNMAFGKLEILSIEKCPLFQGDTPSSLPSLKTLYICWCDKLKVTLPSNCPILEELTLSPCRELCTTQEFIQCSRKASVFFVSSTNWFGRFLVPGIKSLRVVQSYYKSKISDDARRNVQIIIERCPKLLTWNSNCVDIYSELSNVTRVTLGNCKEMNEFLKSNFPASIRSLQILKDHTIEHVSNLTMNSIGLEELRIQTSSLITISNLPLTLKVLAINHGTEIRQPTKEWRLDLLTSLRILDINDVGSSTNSIVSIPDPNELPLPSSLVELSIVDFINLKIISCSTLPNLAKLRIQGCPNITREDILVPQGFVFNTRDAKCKVDLQGYEFQRP